MEVERALAHTRGRSSGFQTTMAKFYRKDRTIDAQIIVALVYK